MENERKRYFMGEWKEPFFALYLCWMYYKGGFWSSSELKNCHQHQFSFCNRKEEKNIQAIFLPLDVSLLIQYKKWHLFWFYPKLVKWGFPKNLFPNAFFPKNKVARLGQPILFFGKMLVGKFAYGKSLFVKNSWHPKNACLYKFAFVFFREKLACLKPGCPLPFIEHQPQFLLHPSSFTNTLS